jgi:superoxide dismutase, Cu-Zn family
MRARLLLALLPMLLVAGCERPPATPGITPPAGDPAPAAPAPGVRSEPLAGPAPAGTPATSDPTMSHAARSAQVTLAPTEGNTANGELTLVVENGALRITGHIDGLQANSEHGFHVHERGDCSAPDASSAGDHFAPDGRAHGRPGGPGEHHAGDMPNLQADDSGHAMVDLRLDWMELGSGGSRDAAGRAVVVHRNPDDYASQPAGDAGARIACGVIRLVDND